MLDCYTCGILYTKLYDAQDMGTGKAVCLISWWCLSLIHLHLKAAGCGAYPGIINFCLALVWRVWLQKIYIECIYFVAAKVHVSFFKISLGMWLVFGYWCVEQGLRGLYVHDNKRN